MDRIAYLSISLYFINYIVLFIFPLIYHFYSKRTSRIIYAITITKKQWVRELLSSVVTTPIIPTILLVSYEFNLLMVSQNTETVTVFLRTFFGLFIWNEAYNYYTHLAMHQKRFIWMHIFHHYSRPTTVLSSLSFNVTEKILLAVGIIIPCCIASQLIPVSFYAIYTYLILYFMINSLGHYNIELFPRTYGYTLFGKIFTSPTYHALHHGRYNGNYALATTILDRLHGTYFRDYPDILNQVASGKPMKSFRETIGSDEINSSMC